MTWAQQSKEWQDIADEMIAIGIPATAYKISLEQRKRMLTRGERPMTYEEILVDLGQPSC